MKKYLSLIILGLVICMGASLTTERFGWSMPRAVVATDDTLVSASATTMKDANIPSSAYKPNSANNALEITWTMHANDESCVVYVFAARSNGDIVRVWTGTVTAGTQVSTGSRYYVDTIASSTDDWITTVSEVDGAGNNRMARIVFDTCGYAYFFCQYTGLAGDEDIQEHYSGF